MKRHFSVREMPRHPKVGQKIMFVKYRCGKSGIAIGHGRVEEIIDRDHIKVMVDGDWEKMFNGLSTLTWSDFFAAWRGRRGNMVLS